MVFCLFCVCCFCGVCCLAVGVRCLPNPLVLLMVSFGHTSLLVRQSQEPIIVSRDMAIGMSEIIINTTTRKDGDTMKILCLVLVFCSLILVGCVTTTGYDNQYRSVDRFDYYYLDGQGVVYHYSHWRRPQVVVVDRAPIGIPVLRGRIPASSYEPEYQHIEIYSRPRVAPTSPLPTYGHPQYRSPHYGSISPHRLPSGGSSIRSNPGGGRSRTPSMRPPSNPSPPFFRRR